MMRPYKVYIIGLVLSICFYQELQGQPVKNYIRIDRHAAGCPDSISNSLYTLVNYLTHPARDEFDIVRGIYFWITHNIIYDPANYIHFDRDFHFYLSGNDCFTPNCVLEKRETVCYGYSNLFAAMCNIAGIKNYAIHGYTHNNLSRATHSWNTVCIDGNWYLLDLTNGSGGLTKTNKFVSQFHEEFFLIDPKEYIHTHLPLDPMWQLLNCPVPVNLFIRSFADIDNYLDTAKTCFHYSDSLEVFENLPVNEREMRSAQRAYSFNPANNLVIARGYYNFAGSLARKKSEYPHGDQERIKTINKAIVYYDLASYHLKKVDYIFARIMLREISNQLALIQREL